MHLFTLDTLYRGSVVKRPSKTCKSPYVADVLIDGHNETIMAHAGALGCNGLCDASAVVLMTKLPEKKGAVCSYRIELAETTSGEIVGINPKLAEKIVEVGIMKSERVKSYKREKTILNSRFDFVGAYPDRKHFVLEVKTVPLCSDDGIAYFPHGYRKKKGDAVSPRALKHLDDLIQIATKSDAEALMCYVIQRRDANKFVPSETDPIYKEKFYDAHKAGVKMKMLYVHWNSNGECHMRDYRDFELE